MQSKLPVRVKKKKIYPEKKKCCCEQFLKTLVDNHIDHAYMHVSTQIVSFTEHASTDTKIFESNSTQTKTCEFCNESYQKGSLEIKKLLESINGTLELILNILQDKKEYLYNKLHEEASNKKLKFYYNKNKAEKTKKNLQLGKKFTYTWPEMSRYYGEVPKVKHYLQKLAIGFLPTNSHINIYPKRNSWISARPLSCSDINNYFQPMGQIFERKSFGVSIYPVRLFTLIGQGDLKDNGFDHLGKQKHKKEACEKCEPENDMEIQ